MTRPRSLLVTSYRDWVILAGVGLFCAIGVLILSESRHVMSTATAIFVVAGSLLILALGTRRSVALASASGILMLGLPVRSRWIPQEDIDCVRVVPGGVSVLSSSTVTVVTQGGTAVPPLHSESVSRAGGHRRGCRLAQLLDVPFDGLK